MEWYKAEYTISEEEMILAENDNTALDRALDNESEFGLLLALFLLDDNENKIKKIF